MFFIAYAFKGQAHVFAERVKIVCHSSCRTSAILNILSPEFDYKFRILWLIYQRKSALHRKLASKSCIKYACCRMMTFSKLIFQQILSGTLLAQIKIRNYDQTVDKPSHRDGFFEYPSHMFWMRNKKIEF